ncbi:helix-turn-helix domain-containing protein [Desulfovibrio sp. Huiquan2017]|uniref:helix-turn-helix transcriptional regulator n=1 Tax=Desulfovibrio sp. Huiquan2017 TaxID=2816861 RepID=UPI001A91E036
MKVEDKLIGVIELANILDLSVHTVRTYCSKSPQLLPPSVKIGRSVRFRLSDVNGFLASLDAGQMPVRRGPGRPRKR